MHRFFNVKNGPGVALLDITPDYDHAKSLPYPLAVASLHGSVETAKPSLPSEYGCEGYRRIAEKTDLHFIIYTQDLPGVIAGLQKCWITSKRWPVPVSNVKALTSWERRT